MIDVRDAALGEVLDRAVRAIEPKGDVDRVRRRGTRRRTLQRSAAMVLVALFVVSVTVAGLSLRDREPRTIRGMIPADVSEWARVGSLGVIGWELRVPPVWQVQELPSCPNALQRTGILVSNTNFEFRNPDGALPTCGDRLVLEGFPPGGVALAVTPVGVTFDIGTDSQPDTVLPLSPELLLPTGGVRGGPAHSFLGVWTGDGEVANVRRLVGSQASQADVAALDRLLGSLRVRGADRWVVDKVSPRSQWHGLEIHVERPASWSISRYQGFDVIDAPNPILRLASPSVRMSRVRVGRGGCAALIFSGVRRIGPSGVAVIAYDASETWSTPDYRPRPGGFGSADAVSDERATCGGEIRLIRFGFEEAGSQITVDVALGSLVSHPQAERMAWHILDSLRITDGSP